MGLFPLRVLEVVILDVLVYAFRYLGVANKLAFIDAQYCGKRTVRENTLLR